MVLSLIPGRKRSVSDSRFRTIMYNLWCISRPSCRRKVCGTLSGISYYLQIHHKQAGFGDARHHTVREQFNILNIQNIVVDEIPIYYPNMCHWPKPSIPKIYFSKFIVGLKTPRVVDLWSIFSNRYFLLTPWTMVSITKTFMATWECYGPSYGRLIFQDTLLIY